MRFHSSLNRLPIIAVPLLLLTGCAVTPLRTGERASVEYLCRLDNGQAIAASAPAGSVPGASSSFFSSREEGPLHLTAGVRPEGEEPGLSEDFNSVLASRIALALPGIKPGEKKSLRFTAEPVKRSDGSDRLLPMALVRVRPKEFRIPLADYEARFGRKPAKGDSYGTDPLFTAAVDRVTGTEVVIRFSPVKTEHLTTPFGPAHIRDAKERYEIVLEPKIGSLVRSGPILGRIVRITDTMFVIDYTNPFGGESLDCDIAVSAATRPARDAVTAKK